MQILIIRHGDPDYQNDSLTEKGWREAELLRDRLTQIPIDAFYCSPLGRAKATAKPTLQALHKDAEICDWLREFDGTVIDPQDGNSTCPWDRLPSFFAGAPGYFHNEQWLSMPLFTNTNVGEKYRTVCENLDALLLRHGYRHTQTFFRVEQENTQTIAMFCHFGVACVLLSHLLNISPVALWQGFVALPSSVTTLYTEERQQGIASLRCCGFGDISHLYAGAEPPSFQARFCETFSNFEQRH